MKQLLEAIHRGILRGVNENNNIELLTDLDDDNLDQLDSIQTKSVNNKIDGYIQNVKHQLIDSINTGVIYRGLKEIINNPNNFHRFKGLIPAVDRDHLKELIWIGQKLFGADGNFNWIDTCRITDMSKLFQYSEFNGHIELWDVSNVTNMEYMFAYARQFNQPIGDWDVSNVINMCGMFGYAYEFNQPIGDWNVSAVTNMFIMFECAEKFNQDISQWNVKKVKDHNYMFCRGSIKDEYKPKFK